MSSKYKIISIRIQYLLKMSDDMALELDGFESGDDVHAPLPVEKKKKQEGGAFILIIFYALLLLLLVSKILSVDIIPNYYWILILVIALVSSIVLWIISSILSSLIPVCWSWIKENNAQLIVVINLVGVVAAIYLLHITHNELTLLRESSELTYRPWLSIEGLINNKTSNDYNFSYTLLNYGKLPAKIIKATDSFNKTYHPLVDGSVIFPHQSWVSSGKIGKQAVNINIHIDYSSTGNDGIMKYFYSACDFKIMADGVISSINCSVEQSY